MSVSANWDSDAKRIIRYDFEGHWTWEQFRTAANEAFALTRSVEYRVDTISNFLPGADLPPNALFQFNRIMKNAPPNRGIVVIVGGTMFINNLVSMFTTVYKALGQKIKIAPTLVEARKILAEPASADTASTV